jgi:hypothetical protein
MKAMTILFIAVLIGYGTYVPKVDACSTYCTTFGDVEVCTEKP